MVSDRSTEQSAKSVSVLMVSPLPEDHRALANILAHSNWELRTASTCNEAADLLRGGLQAVIVCEYQLPDGTWRDVQRRAEDLHVPSRILVSSRQADDALWAEVLNAGGYDCLAKPFQADEVFRVISLAWQSWKRESKRSLERLPRVQAAGAGGPRYSVA